MTKKNRSNIKLIGCSLISLGISGFILATIIKIFIPETDINYNVYHNSCRAIVIGSTMII